MGLVFVSKTLNPVQGVALTQAEEGEAEEEEDDIDSLFKKKRKKKTEVSQEVLDMFFERQVAGFMRASVQDAVLNRQKQPATKKLKMLPELKRQLLTYAISFFFFFFFYPHFFSPFFPGPFPFFPSVAFPFECVSPISCSSCSDHLLIWSPEGLEGI